MRQTGVRALVALMGILPCIFTLKSFQGMLVYASYINWPWVDFKNPSMENKMKLLDNYLPYQAQSFPGIPNAEYIRINSDSGSLGGWVMTPEKEASGPVRAVVYFHGNGCNRAGFHHLDKYKMLTSLGLKVFAFDYRGFGDSEGYPDEEGLYEDARDIFRYVQDQGFKSSSILVWGHSLGGAVGIYIAGELSVAKMPPHSMVLESTFSSVEHVVRDLVPTFWFKFLEFFENFELFGLKFGPFDLEGILWHKFPSIDRISRISNKTHILVLHGLKDEILSPDHSQRLYDSISETRRDLTDAGGLWYLRDKEGRHNDVSFRNMATLHSLIEYCISHPFPQHTLQILGTHGIQ
ncbi:hypothetical protein AAMO2058_000017400 [Amorphochlora amoebiformis]